LHDGHCLAIAAPGSGKTKTLAVKAALLLSRGKSVTAVTFTRDAALELRDRILAIAGQQAVSMLLVGTFHSIDLLMAFPGKQKTAMGADILRKGHSRLSRPWEIVREGSRRGFVACAIEHAELEPTIEEATAVIEGIKSGHSKPETQRHAELAATYQDIMGRHGVIDFQDILLKTNEALDQGVISPLQCDHLLIDEFQDTDLAQFKWAMHHRKSSVLTAVGDDDQSIYTRSEMRARVQRIKEMIAAPSEDKKPGGNPVVLLTAHGSKGLEFDEVWILGAEDGVFPDESSSIQEERRLFYVAMTRARKMLFISAAGKAPLSPFLVETGIARMPESGILNEGQGA